MQRLLLLVPLVLALSIAVACGDDDDDDGDDIFEPTTSVTETAGETPSATATVEPTTEPTTAPTGEPTAEPTEDDGGDTGGASACADAPEDVLPTVLQALNDGDPEAVFNCFASAAQDAFGPDAEAFENGDYSAFSEGLGSFPVDTPVILTQELEESQLGEQIAVSAIAGDRMVEGTEEENAVYATLLVFEGDSWRMNPVGEFFLSELSPEQFTSVPAGPLTIAFNIDGLDPGAAAAADIRIFFNGGQVTEPSVEAFEGVRVSAEVTAQAGPNYVIAYVENEGETVVFGWSFAGE